MERSKWTAAKERRRWPGECCAAPDMRANAGSADVPVGIERAARGNETRLCRLMCGKALPLPGRDLFFDYSHRDKAEPCRDEKEKCSAVLRKARGSPHIKRQS